MTVQKKAGWGICSRQVGLLEARIVLPHPKIGIHVLETTIETHDCETLPQCEGEDCDDACCSMTVQVGWPKFQASSSSKGVHFKRGFWLTALGHQNPKMALNERHSLRLLHGLLSPAGGLLLWRRTAQTS